MVNTCAGVMGAAGEIIVAVTGNLCLWASVQFTATSVKLVKLVKLTFTW